MQDKSGNEFDHEVNAELPSGWSKSGLSLNTSLWLKNIRAIADAALSGKVIQGRKLGSEQWITLHGEVLSFKLDVEYRVKPNIEKWVKLFEFGDRQVLVTKALNADGIPAVRLETAADNLEHSIATEFTFDDCESFDEQWTKVDSAFNDVTSEFAFKRINGILGMFGKRMTEAGEIIKKWIIRWNIYREARLTLMGLN